MTQQCVFCGNKHLTPKTTRYLHQNQDQDEMLIVEQVPCIECDFCGEQYFDIQVLKKLKPITKTSTCIASFPADF
jgi:YgiT-type zinc finger domain-containing protein